VIVQIFITNEAKIVVSQNLLLFDFLYITPKSARSLKGRAFLLRKERDALNCPLDFIVRFTPSENNGNSGR